LFQLHPPLEHFRDFVDGAAASHVDLGPVHPDLVEVEGSHPYRLAHYVVGRVFSGCGDSHGRYLKELFGQGYVCSDISPVTVECLVTGT
jgi:hypothetical protein